MVECTALEMRRALTGTVGSNPTLSATKLPAMKKGRPVAGTAPFSIGTGADAQAARSYSPSSSVITGPESCPLALVSRSTNSITAMGEASDRRMPALMIRV